MCEAASKLRTAGEAGKLTRKAAMHFMKGIDHALSMVCKGLFQFKSRGSVQKLGPSDKRYMCTRKRKCPFPVPDGVPQLRSCKYNCDSKKAVYDMEIPADLSPLPCLTMVGDEGPKDLPFFCTCLGCHTGSSPCLTHSTDAPETWQMEPKSATCGTWS